MDLITMSNHELISLYLQIGTALKQRGIIYKNGKLRTHQELISRPKVEIYPNTKDCLKRWLLD